MIEDTRSIIYKLNKFYSLSKQELSELQADMKRMIEIAEVSTEIDNKIRAK